MILTKRLPFSMDRRAPVRAPSALARPRLRPSHQMMCPPQQKENEGADIGGKINGAGVAARLQEVHPQQRKEQHQKGAGTGAQKAVI